MDIVSQAPIASRLFGRTNAGRAIADRYYKERGEIARKRDVLQDRVQKGEDPASVFDPDKAEVEVDGLMPAVYKKRTVDKRTGAVKFPGDPKVTEKGGVEVQVEPGSVSDMAKQTRKLVTQGNKAIRAIRDPKVTNARVAAIAESFELELSDIGLPEDFTAETTAPNRVRQRAIKRIQEARAVDQQKLLKALEFERRVRSVRKDRQAKDPAAPDNDAAAVIGPLT